MTTHTGRVGMSMENEKSFLRWGGLVGILAFIVWIVDLPVYGYVDPFVPDGLMRFPDVRVALAVNTILCMTIAFLSVTFVLVLYRVLRGTSQSLALLGSVFKAKQKLKYNISYNHTLHSHMCNPTTRVAPSDALVNMETSVVLRQKRPMGPCTGTLD